MRLVNIPRSKETEDFARDAAVHFVANINDTTYAKGDPAPGELLAIRWNPCTVLVLEIAEVEPLLYDAVQLCGRQLHPFDPEA